MNKVDIQIFNHNDVNHMRCIRDVEMEIRYGNKCPVFSDEHNDVRQHIRDVLINKTVENKEITEFYNFMVNMLANVSKEVRNYE
jgi:hypothetical protein